MSKYNIAGIKTCTEAEGPFRRTAIWFQGCSIGCEGCCNPGLRPFAVRHIMSMEELLDVCIDSSRRFGTEGVTLLGGEPTLQDIVPFCRGLRENGLGVILFTGFDADSLDADLRRNVDLIVDGPYDAGMRDDRRNLVGSSNQRIIDVSGRYSGCMGWFEEKRGKRVEASLGGCSISVSGDVFFVDSPSNGDRARDCLRDFSRQDRANRRSKVL